MSAPPPDFHPDARLEIREAFEWYADRSLEAAAGFVDELEAAIGRIQETPRTWRRGEHGTRRHGLRRFPYTIVYRLEGERITIIAVSRDSRRPGYWKTRL